MSQTITADPSRVVECLPWVGLVCAGLGLGCSAVIPGTSPTMFAAHGFGPDDLKAWATAAGAAASALCGAAHTVILLVRLVRRRPKPKRKRKEKPHAPPPMGTG